MFPAEGKPCLNGDFPNFSNVVSGRPNLYRIHALCSAEERRILLKEFYGGNIPFIRSAEIGKSSTELFITEEGFRNSSAKMVKKGDVLIALYGANSGEVALCQINGAINQAILCLRHETCNGFVYHYLEHKKNRIISKYLQGGQGNLSGQIIKAIILFFPSRRNSGKLRTACQKQTL